MQISAIFPILIVHLTFLLSVLAFSSSWKPSILLFTTHDGTISELNGVITTLFKGQAKTSLITSSQRTLKEGVQIQQKLCDPNQIIIISNAIPLAYSLLEWIAFGEDACANTAILLNITNRFDYEVPNKGHYLQIMKLLTEKSNVFWVPNNPFELEWLRLSGIKVPEERSFLCLPVGYPVEVPRSSWPKSLHKQPMITSKRSDFWALAASKHLIGHSEFTENAFVFDVAYGGVKAMKEYFDWFFYVPYQFSTMKVFEALRAGVIMVVPGETMFKQMVRDLRAAKAHEYTLPQMKQCIWKEHPQDWQRFFDVYSPANEGLVLKLDSWQQLRDWLKAGRILGVDLGEHSQFVTSKMQQHERVQLALWKRLFGQIEKQQATKDLM